MKKGFTLAEIMIVLTVIGILSAILMPIAMQSAPDKNVMKFKKGHAAFATAIKELVNSSRYYLDGDLGLMPSGARVTSATYMCQTLGEILTTKSINCSSNTQGQFYIDSRSEYCSGHCPADLDTICQNNTQAGKEIETPDGIVFYQVRPSSTFGTLDGTYGTRFFAAPQERPTHPDAFGFDAISKVFCMDIDGIGTGEKPFGYGVRADGKITLGPRADEWSKKKMSDK